MGFGVTANWIEVPGPPTPQGSLDNIRSLQSFNFAICKVGGKQ